MNSITQHYIVDLSSNNNYVQISTVQGDGNNTRYIEIELMKNGSSYTVDPSKTYVSIIGTKPDGTEVWNSCDVTQEGYIKVPITYQMSSAAGKGTFQIMIFSRESNNQIKSFPFYLVVTKAAYDPSYIMSKDEFQQLTDIAGASEIYAREAEGWAVGQKDGVDVDPSDETYHNNSKYYAEQAATSEANAAYSEETAASSAGDAAVFADNAAGSAFDANERALEAEAWAVGQRDGSDVSSSDITYHNNSKYYAANAATSESNASTSETNAANSATSALHYATAAESWAVGGTHSRTNEDYNNAKYWCEQAEAVAGGITTEDMIAPVEETTVSTRKYEIGDRFIYNHVKYKATSVINIGTIIVPGTNCIEAESAEEHINTKADKASNPTNGNLAALDSNGNLTDSGNKASDFLTEHQDISGKMNTDGSNAASTVDMPSMLYCHGLKAVSSVGTGGAGFARGTAAAIGYNSTSTEDNLKASGFGSFAQGYAGGGAIQSTSFGSFASGYSNSNGSKIEATSYGTHAEGSVGYGSITASNHGAHAGGRVECTSSGSTTRIEASGVGSHAEGYVKGTASSGSGSDNNISATSAGAHAEGYVTNVASIRATGEGAHAEGKATYGNILASGEGAHAEGYMNSNGKSHTASGAGSHVEGSQNVAGGTCSHAEGSLTTAAGSYSHSAGYGSCAGNQYSEALGYMGRADLCSSYQYDGQNASDTSNNIIFGIGGENIWFSNFTSDRSGRNVFSVDYRGNVFTQGAQSIARGILDGLLVASGPRITLEDGASYILFYNSRVRSTGAWRGAQAYFISATYNPLGTGTSTTAQGAPQVAALGSVGTAGISLARETESYTLSGNTRYHSKLGIGSCSTNIKVRWSLVKVLGSEADF